ncbi:type IV toxin-antitoxin system AbiEi family antitoxin domain-containing protein [Cumulibacter soli]|uniref:type IV toxin-antitoxin system AbiEi family antitoxin domain-containing protein n=1 Tax=Cumulibacter soli TaxID=2546344 RepID=UPI001067644D|nr:type IV toxin-antitoxin system AbiEi family antitoxin domain-containing protein [Cumulibacter soli]
MSAIPDHLSRLLAEQQNVVTAAQLSAVGMPRSRLRWLVHSGNWQRMASGVYYCGRGTAPWLSTAWAASLIGGPGSVIGGTAAAHMHGLQPKPPAEIRVFTGQQRQVKSRDGVRFVRSVLSRRTQTVADLRCTTVPETILDCASELPGEELEALIGRAFGRRLCNRRALHDALSQRRGIEHRQLLAAASADAEAGAHSLFEMIYLRKVERAHSLRGPERQFRVGPARAWVDVHYVQYRVIIELDGQAFHEGAPFRDRTRDNRNSHLGAVTLRFGWADVIESPCEVARDVTQALSARGWEPAALRACGPACTLSRTRL